MSKKRVRLTPVLGLLLLAVVATSWADAWQGRLKGGGSVQVDPQTHRPVVEHPGGRTQLWDGVHEMQDGSVLIVRDGVVVPDERMINSWTGLEQDETEERPPHCEELVRKTCGFDDECGGSPGCAMARQLRRLEQDQAAGIAAGSAAGSGSECRAGLADDALFPACQAALRGRNTVCGQLVERVCGEQRQCAEAGDCRLARQLLDMDNEERMGAADPHAATETERQCRQARDEGTFKACGK